MRRHNRSLNTTRVLTAKQPSAQRATGFLPDTTTPPSTNPNSRWKTKTDKTFKLSIASHITISSKVELSVKRVSLLLEQEIVRVATEGINLIDYFSFEWMMNYLVGSRSIHEVQGKKMSTVVYCANLILLAYRDNTDFLYSSSPIYKKLEEFISDSFGRLSDRKYQGRAKVYDIGKFLLVKIEDVEVVFERKSGSVRYSSYCKGYGEGGRSVRKQKTRYSFELDRDDSEQTLEEINSFEKSIHDQEDLFEIEQMIREEKKKA